MTTGTDFNRWSETYEHSFMQWLVFGPIQRRVLNSLPPGFIPGAALDVGCGTGRLLRRMHSCWPQAKLIGIDPAEGMVAQARRFTPNATIYHAPAEQIPLDSASVDLVTTTMSFHHWANQEVAVGEVVRVLRPGGYFILADVNIGHGHPLSKAEVRQLFQSCSFSIVSQRSIIPYVTVTVAEKS